MKRVQNALSIGCVIYTLNTLKRYLKGSKAEMQENTFLLVFDARTQLGALGWLPAAVGPSCLGTTFTGPGGRESFSTLGPGLVGCGRTGGSQLPAEGPNQGDSWLRDLNLAPVSLRYLDFWGRTFQTLMSRCRQCLEILCIFIWWFCLL